MNTIFRTVFQVKLQHSFYTDSLCRDFELFPVGDTRELLRNRQSVFSFRETFGIVMTQENAGGTSAAHPIESGDAFVFGMRLLKPRLINVTNEWPALKKVFLYTNDGNTSDPSAAPVELIRKEARLTTKTITHSIVTNDAATLVLKNENGRILTTLTIDAGSAGLEQAFDVQQLSNGLYTVTETVNNTSTNYLYYADNELFFDGVFGIVRIVNQKAFPFAYDGKPVYTISFTAKSSAWKYYVVATSLSGSDIADQLNIRDTGRMGDAAIVFDKTYPVPGTDQTVPLLSSDSTKVALFTSQTELTYQQQPRKQIELRKGSSALVANLPNPDVSKPVSEMYIYV